MSLFIPNHEQEPWGNGVINKRADEKFWYFSEALAVFIIQLKTCFAVFSVIISIVTTITGLGGPRNVIMNCYFARTDVKVKRTEGNYGERDRSVSISGNYEGTLNDDLVEVKKMCSFLLDKLCLNHKSRHCGLDYRWLPSLKRNVLLCFYHFSTMLSLPNVCWKWPSFNQKCRRFKRLHRNGGRQKEGYYPHRRMSSDGHVDMAN